MKKIFYFLYLVCFFSYSQDKKQVDYSGYHLDINKAETFYFGQKNIDSSLFYYDKVFKNFDFIFVKDIVNAAQISVFSNKPYQKYIELGFLHGLKLNHLNNYPLFKKDLSKLLKDKKLLNTYVLNRKKYLAKLDFKYLDWVYKLAIKDQKDKYNKDLTFKNCNLLMDSVFKKGFPGDKIIGISDSAIFKEIGKPHLNFYQQTKKDKNLKYMISDDISLSNCKVDVLLFHVKCSYQLYKDQFLKEIKLGNIHPREVAFLHDNTYDSLDSLPFYCDKIKIKGAYLVWDYPEIRKKTTTEITNQMREKLFIVSLKVDEIKEEFQKLHGFRLFSGFYGCR